MLRMRDLEAKEAYLHERKLTARKINRKREKRKLSSNSFQDERRRSSANKELPKQTDSVDGYHDLPRTYLSRTLSAPNTSLSYGLAGLSPG